MSGTRLSGRRPEGPPATRAGRRILEWAAEELSAGRPAAIQRLAEACGVSRYTVARWITGSAYPEIREAIRVRDVAGVEVEWWVEPAEHSHGRGRPAKK